MVPEAAPPSLSALLDEALRLTAELEQALRSLAPTDCAVPRTAPVELEALSVDEKLMLGQAAARRLTALAGAVDPETVLDSLENRLPAHSSSLTELSELLRRLQGTD